MRVLQRLQAPHRLESPRATSSDEREDLLDRVIADQQRAGWRLTARSRFRAVLVKGRRPNHRRHLVLTLVTFGLWGVVWLAISIFGGEKRQVVAIDDKGKTIVQR